MRRKLPTFSEFGRVAACPASHILPHVYSTGEDAVAGNVVGAWTQRAVFGDVSLENVPKEHRAACQAVDLKKLGEELLFCGNEEAYAITRDGAVYLGSNKGRDYSGAPEGSVCGSLDLLAVSNDPVRPVIVELKNGNDAGHPSVNWQVRLQALAVAADRDRPEGSVEARIFYTRTNYFESHIFDALDFDSTRAEMRQVLQRLEEAEANPGVLDVTEGEHCKYCPAFHACPAKRSLVRSMLGPLDEVTPATAGEMWAKLKAFQSAADKVEKTIKEMAARKRIPLPNGKLLGIVESSRTSVDSAALTELAKSLGATDEQVSACSKTLQFTQTREFKAEKKEAAE